MYTYSYMAYIDVNIDLKKYKIVEVFSVTKDVLFISLQFKSNPAKSELHFQYEFHTHMVPRFLLSEILRHVYRLHIHKEMILLIK